MLIGRIHYVVRKIDQELSEAALRSGVVTKDRREGRIPERLWETLAESLASTGIVAQATP